MSFIESKVKEFKSKCREHHLALTVQRLAVYDVLINTKSHPTADWVYDQVKEHYPSLSRTSVYRILDIFVQNGLIQKLAQPGTAVRYDGNPDRHNHLVCRKCGKIFDLDSDIIESGLDLEIPCLMGDFEVDDYTLVFIGTCVSCRKQQQERNN